ncbi:unnamed protein product [Pipistrellus nathusii]|uniref:Ig-like domain-containing protein n=1 Tax=Pipistrellus nathusii TaxID=59473 RepID=A0ABN9ZGE7_PIPNA
MVPLLLVLLLPLCRGSLQQQAGFELQMQESVTVFEGLCVHVPCSFSYPWSSWSSSGNLYTYWYRDGNNQKRGAPVASSNPSKPGKVETRYRFLLADPKTNNCSLQIKDARRELESKMAAQVDKPHIHIPELLESGRPTQLTCSLPGDCKGGQRFIFSWAGAAVDSLNPQNLSSSVLTFTPSPRDHGTNLTCQVKQEWRPLISQRAIRLNVSYAPQNLTIDVSFRNDTALKILQTTSLPILEGEALRLLCVADSNPPAKLSWFQGFSGLNTTPISTTGILELPRVGPAQEGEFTCQAQHPLGSQSVSLSLSVVWKAVLQAGVVPAALGGAGAMALLSLCLCLICFCIVKARMRQAAGRPKVTNDEDPVMGPVTWGSKKTLQPDGPPDQVSPAEKGPLSGEQQELHYANLTFEGMKPRGPQDQEATSTHEYSEIKHTGK